MSSQGPQIVTYDGEASHEYLCIGNVGIYCQQDVADGEITFRDHYRQGGGTVEEFIVQFSFPKLVRMVVLYSLCTGKFVGPNNTPMDQEQITELININDVDSVLVVIDGECKENTCGSIYRTQKVSQAVTDDTWASFLQYVREDQRALAMELVPLEGFAPLRSDLKVSYAFWGCDFYYSLTVFDARCWRLRTQTREKVILRKRLMRN